MNINDIKDLVKFIKSNKIKEFYYKKGDEEVSVKLSYEERAARDFKYRVCEKKGYPAQIEGIEQARLAKLSAERAQTVEPELTYSKKGALKEILSPFVGSFFRSQAPDKPPFVEVDSVVEKNSPICIVEAMKIMNEIEVDIKCRIISILVENGQLVEYGQPLFLVEPL
ncbi:MAG: acetyl-CoA carboxylase biotin carboxyl carrier protein [Deltaproteobacteria bacterium]|nr:acetyl-CoA carboxylase biotin carboxyl carrier protein [Deltaproteobacteria bacterium]